MGAIPPSGFPEGVFADYGEYDECLAVASDHTNRFPIVRGKYCLSNFILPFPALQSINHNIQHMDEVLDIGLDLNQMYSLNAITFRNFIEALNMINGTVFQLGICIPAVCRPHEIEDMLNQSKTFTYLVFVFAKEYLILSNIFCIIF